MANEKRLIDANALWWKLETEPWYDNADRDEIALPMVDNAHTVDAVEASRLGNLGRLMMPYIGCPRGRMGARGDGRIIELDPIKDVEGDIWVPVLEEDLNFLKAKAVEVVHGRWLPDMEEFDDDPAIGIRGGVYQTGWKCSICGRSEQAKEPFCNCGAKMDGERKDNERNAD